jgi:hypothetical protein
MQKKYPTTLASAMARALKRVAVKYAVARRAKYLEKETLSALKDRQSALSYPREINSGGHAPSTIADPNPKSSKVRVRSPNPLDEDLRWGDLMIEAAKEALERKKAKATANSSANPSPD